MNPTPHNSSGEHTSTQDYLRGLNEKQKEAVLQTEGPLLILAGAGAGKTKTVTHRILHLIRQGVSPDKILAITFTNKAAREMKEKVEKLIATDRGINFPISEASRPFVSTFHSLGVYILREAGSAVGVNRNFTIYDRSDSRSTIKEILVDHGYDPKQWEPSKILSTISRAKGDFQTPSMYEADHEDSTTTDVIVMCWREYDAKLAKEKALDFDDLLYKTAELLEKHPKVREFFQQKWQYVHIDEYQDTNRVQYVIASQLLNENKNIAVVGDIDQNIYSWRGADIKNILSFESDYPEAKIVVLEENYRSTTTILEAANTIIEKNIHRRKKNLFTKNGEGEKISVYTAIDEGDEARFIADKCRDLINAGTAGSEICVLYRANFQSRAIEEAFLNKSVPYQILGTKFFERKEIKDLLSYIRAAVNPDSTSDIKRTINTPARGIGKVTMLKVLQGASHELSASQIQKVNQYHDILRSIAGKVKTEKASEVVKHALLVSGLEQNLREESTPDENRLENARELATLATKYDNLPAPEGIEKLLEEAALASDQDELDQKQKSSVGNDKNGVKLMTIHASKGLEFDYVFITGLEQDLFPHSKVNEPGLTPEEREEERRLFYVALTRARKKLYLTHAHLRTIYGSKNVCSPSEFISDIDESLLDQTKPEPLSGIKSIFIDF